MPPGTPNWHPFQKKFPLKLIPSSRNGPIFLYPVLEMDQFFILRSRVQQEYNGLLVNALDRIFKSNLSLNNYK